MFKQVLAAFAVLMLVTAPAAAHPRDVKAHHAHRGADIIDTAVAAGQFQTLAAALGAAGLVDTLKGDGPFTVFAPTDEAFRALPPGTVERLLRPENRDELVRVLSYHVIAGRVEAGDLAGRQVRPETVAGPRLSIDARQGVSVNNARVVRADVDASNGVIHVIDRVLLPPTH